MIWAYLIIGLISYLFGYFALGGEDHEERTGQGIISTVVILILLTVFIAIAKF